MQNPCHPLLILLFVLSRNKVSYLAPLHVLGITNFLTEGKIEKGIIMILLVFFWYRSDH